MLNVAQIAATVVSAPLAPVATTYRPPLTLGLGPQATRWPRWAWLRTRRRVGLNFAPCELSALVVVVVVVMMTWRISIAGPENADRWGNLLGVASGQLGWWRAATWGNRSMASGSGLAVEVSTGIRTLKRAAWSEMTQVVGGQLPLGLDGVDLGWLDGWNLGLGVLSVPGLVVHDFPIL